jgi:hypothetical protein
MLARLRRQTPSMAIFASGFLLRKNPWVRHSRHPAGWLSSPAMRPSLLYKVLRQGKTKQPDMNN